MLFVAEVKWCNYKPAKVVENGRVHIFWDFNIQRDYAIQQGPTYFCCTKLKESVTLLILLCLGKRIGLKEQEKLDNYYSELKWEVKKILNLSQIMAVLVVIGALRVTCKEWLKT